MVLAGVVADSPETSVLTVLCELDSVRQDVSYLA